MLESKETETQTPKTIGIIMDGNRRFAKEHSLATFEGHRAGYEKLKELLKWAENAGIENVVVYAFSTENWKRDEKEVSYLLNLMREAFIDAAEELNKGRGAITFIGDITRFPKDIQKGMKDLEARKKNEKGLHLYIAVSYGGRSEILNAVKKLLAKKFSSEDVTEELFSKELYTASMPDPDLIIRTSGEMRLSNFLLWQSAYSELFFTPTYWPAFSEAEFNEILEAYQKRKRRFGA